MDAAPAAPTALPLAVELFAEAAARLGLRATPLDHEFGYLWELSDGAGYARAVVGAKVPINDASASQIAGDKHYCGLVLERCGFRVPRTARCLSPRRFGAGPFADRVGPEPALALAREIGLPLVVKPNGLSHGRGVERVDGVDELSDALERLFEVDEVALAQELVEGREFRLDALDGELLVGYERAALKVRGDGRRTAVELLEELDPRFRDPASRAERLADARTSRAARGRDLDAVLPAGEELDLSRGVMNLNRCATARLLDGLPAAWAAWLRRLGRSLGLRHYGVDVRAPSLEADPEREAVVIEVNAAPLVNQIALMGHRDLAVEAQTRVLRALCAPSPLVRPRPRT